MSYRIAVDYAATLDRWPDALGHLCRSLYAQGWDVVVLAGQLGPASEVTEDAAAQGERVSWLASRRIPWTRLCVATAPTHEGVAAQKGIWLGQNPCAVYVDDDPLYCGEARRRDPRLCVLRVEP